MRAEDENDGETLTYGIGEYLVFGIVYITGLFTLLNIFPATLVLIASIAYFVSRLRHRYGYWRRVGVPGPKPSLLVGNSAQLLKNGIHVFDAECVQKYGETFGDYAFGKADLCSANIDLLRQALVKQFNNFVDRLNIIAADEGNENDLFAHLLTTYTGDRWREVRSSVSPAFASQHIKKMVPLFNECGRIFADELGKSADSNSEVLIKNACSRLTLDMIARSAFSLEEPIQTQENVEMVRQARTFFEVNFWSLGLLFTMFFPVTTSYIEKWTGFKMIARSGNAYFLKLLSELYETRKQQMADGTLDTSRMDFIAVFLKSKEEEEEKAKREGAEAASRSPLTRMSIMGQSMIFLLAGYETTSTALNILFYHLAALPDIQKKVRDELLEQLGHDEDPDAEALSRLPYTDQVALEVLRLYPPAIRVNRLCTSACELGGIPIRKGDTFSVPIREVHTDERYYPDPWKFDPDRFSPEARNARDPLTFLAFGAGPRNCIGQRVAHFQLRAAVASVVRKFEFSLPPGAPSLPLEIVTNASFRTKETLKVLVKRID